MSETSQLTGPIAKALRQMGYLTIRMQSGRIPKGNRWIYLCEEGTADLLCFPWGKPPHWFETKIDGESTAKSRRKAQDEFRQKVEALGHVYLRAKSLDDVLAIHRARRCFSALV